MKKKVLALLSAEIIALSTGFGFLPNNLAYADETEDEIASTIPQRDPNA